MRGAIRRLLKGGAAAGLGAGAAAAFAPNPWWGVLPIALALFFAWLARAATARQSAALSLAFGWGYFFAGLSWIAVALARYGGLSWPLALLAVALLALFLAVYWGMAGWITWRLWQLRRSPLVPALVWVVAEWLRGWLFSGFPWLMPGVAAAQEGGSLNGYFPLIGALGVTGLLVGVAAAWGVSWRWPATWGVTIALFAGGWAAGHRTWSEAAGEPIAVSVVQTAVTPSEKWDVARWETHVAALAAEVAAAAQGAVVVMPETVLPLFADQVPREWRQRLEAAAGSKQLVVGLFERDAAGIHNALVSEPLAWRYHKRQLVPFGEYTPPFFRWLAERLTIPFTDQAPGAAVQPPLWVAGVPWRANICYESAFARWIVADVRAGAAVLINASNFAWYGVTHGQWQHLQVARARALETARPWVQAVNAGVSAVLGPKGETIAVAPAWQAVRLEAHVVPQQGLTPFVRWGGEGTVAGASLLLLGALLSSRRKSGR